MVATTTHRVRYCRKVSPVAGGLIWHALAQDPHEPVGGLADAATKKSMMPLPWHRWVYLRTFPAEACEGQQMNVSGEVVDTGGSSRSPAPLSVVKQILLLKPRAPVTPLPLPVDVVSHSLHGLSYCTLSGGGATRPSRCHPAEERILVTNIRGARRSQDTSSQQR